MFVSVFKTVETEKSYEKILQQDSPCENSFLSLEEVGKIDTLASKQNNFTEEKAKKQPP